MKSQKSKRLFKIPDWIRLSLDKKHCWKSALCINEKFRILIMCDIILNKDWSNLINFNT